MRVINVMGVSIDGRIASHPNESDAERKRYGFTNEADHEHLRALLRTCDAVIVGGHSVNVSGGVMEVEREDGVCPTWVLCSNRGFKADAAIWNFPNTPKWLVSKEPVSEERSAPASKTLVYGTTSMPEAVLRECRAAGFECVLLFGGGVINREFYNAGCVDEMILTVCPVVVGRETGVPVVAPELDAPVHFELKSMRREGDLAFLHYIVRS